MKIDVITSFNQHYYDLIGQHSLESWFKYWPENLSITVYTEGMNLEPRDRLCEIGFDNLPAGYYQFQLSDEKSRTKTFAKKAWSVIHAMQHSQADRLIWIDADVITKQSIPMSLLHSILPDSVLSTHMGVWYTESKDGRTGRWFVPETGFFAVNLKHKLFDQFRLGYQTRYETRNRHGLRKFYDNDVYGVVIQELAAPCLDLCAEFNKPYKTPLRHTVLAPYLDHYKAKHSKRDFNQALDQ